MNRSPIFSLLILIIMSACNNSKTTTKLTDINMLSGKELGIPVKLPSFNPEKDITSKPDYTNSDSWVSIPDWFDTTKQEVDVFWVYPTILSDDSTYLMDIKNESLRKQAEWTIIGQASVFNGLANIYAPYYRQNNVNINPLMLTEASPIFKIGQEDLINAFDYFIKNFNKGERPIIIAGHSQGSVRIVELSKDKELLMGDSLARSKMIATYAIGYSITDNDIKENPLIEIADSSLQTGCFITYNTISDEPGIEKKGPTIIAGTYVVNPLSWKTNTEFVPASENIEAVFFNHENPEKPQFFKHFAAAQKKDNALVITDISHPEMISSTSVTFPKGIYHVYDYAIFYGNLKKNIADRIAEYFSNNNQ